VSTGKFQTDLTGGIIFSSTSTSMSTTAGIGTPGSVGNGWITKEQLYAPLFAEEALRALQQDPGGPRPHHKAGTAKPFQPASRVRARSKRRL
jgi:hypothetical protein